ncbi:peptidoglycan/xylan/chitin deacetylase (PgdA/CDA1 family) [Dyadobacter sp. BE34]|uniref:Peptidoglycan/xylan/chitin deacetylase (PgdA/CDA1 family) n=1 Tax=Dyadobacter fermentans TaxID=94254 RepID=A0ABU1R531_9BACT|nr:MULTISPECIES: polysaccharide deacetylase family protein [Dyadobacter]MDR6807685.1 peptidoglycan/xylan/chitin deacetylase (PgdA/CDA1 family) [Dyadobacter fermentans]MDR7045426.1 peptidoglycan/xylan/chitin deacetylase (PgdA/CDA1 family) [Dyadobacter sp. BE242]MDR7199739.1 peptidoglycan/xylan/chitin deacetylase (PgdA/CDA1 family) [Dyadobacter sp. BE34]MDR7217802.1 peptidoglycan/xylan/chitin deacetylase (PgdA/CDA1 family) [Dyadobacter sp. BE31]MDR7265630.1 peptidoglycan/xylan/chitin deacetylase
MKYIKTSSNALNGLRGLLLFVLASVFWGCGSPSGKPDAGGIAISFDDHFIKEWYELRPLFQKYNAKATFFITCPDSLNAEEVAMLKQLEKEGHEIGFHGTVHAKSTELMAAGGPKGYIEAELEPGLRHMHAAGFKPTSYAHPGGNHNDRVDSVLLAKGFTILRDVAISRRKFKGIQLYAWPPRWMNAIYYAFKGEQKVDALMIDYDEVTEEEIVEAIREAKENGTALMVFGHEPLYSAPQNGKYGFNVSFLAAVLREADKQKLKFYTMSELPKVK